MAAELLLTFAMQETLTRVSSIAACRRDQTCLGIEGPAAKARQVFVVIQAVLREAAKTPETDDSVKLLLERLQDVAYDAEDVLDEFASKILRKEQKKGKF